MESKINEIDRKLSKLIDRIRNVEDINKEINSNTVTLNESLEHISKELDLLKKKLEKKEKDIVELKKTNQYLSAHNRCLKEDIKQLRISNEQMIFQQHANELDILGIDNCNNDDMAEKIIYAGNKWKLNMKKSDILNIEQRSIRNKTEKFFRIKFKNQQIKNDFLSEAKKSRTKEKDLNLPEKNRRIYFNEILSSYTRKIFFHARNLKRDQNWKYVWNKNGKIYNRKEESSPAILINSLEEIETLKS